ncbi:MAG: hypothetical protein R2710_23280 [Acidimicrobiales bacterium]
MAGSIEAKATRRRRILRGSIAAVLVVFFGFGWLDRSDEASLSFGDRRRIVVVSDAGPVEVRSGTENRASHSDSFLVRRPTVELANDGDEAVFRVRCETRWPCRATTSIEVVPGTELVVIADAGAVQVHSFAGNLTVFSDRDDVLLGPIAGSARVVSATGDVAGFGLALEQLTVELDDASMALEFAAPPLTVVLTNDSGNVDLVVPDTGYDLTVVTDDDMADQVDVGVGAAAETGSTVSIRSGGPVTVSPFDQATQ